jgi:hypothetical protein
MTKRARRFPKTDAGGNPITSISVDQVSKADSFVNNDAIPGKLSHKQCIFDALPTELTQEERQFAVDFIQKMQICFRNQSLTLDERILFSTESIPEIIISGIDSNKRFADIRVLICLPLMNM